MTTKNPYLILNISPTANDHEIKVQYKKLAKKYHPDTHPDDTIAMEKMLELNEAYEMLKNQSASDMAFLTPASLMWNFHRTFLIPTTARKADYFRFSLII